MEKNAGFTLLELLMVLAIVAILHSVAYPAFQNILRASHRSDAMAALLRLQLAQENLRVRCAFYAQNLGTASMCGSGPANTDVVGSASSPDDNYDISIKGGSASGGNYVALAAPVGAQRDDDCGSFAIDQDGPVYDHKGIHYADAGCWGK